VTATSILGVGDTAPDFELRGTHDGDRDSYRLGDYTDAGQWVFLTFYAFDFNPICTAGMCALRDAEFFALYDDLAVLGVSGDGIHSHERFAEHHDINYPLLSDTAKDVADQYGVVREEYEGMRRVHQRAVFVIDDSRTVRFATTMDAASPEDIELGPINDVLRDLKA
jgi:peroxiredoxin Q/BCP